MRDRRGISHLRDPARRNAARGKDRVTAFRDDGIPWSENGLGIVRREPGRGTKAALGRVATARSSIE